jgi:serine protease inhibitor
MKALLIASLLTAAPVLAAEPTSIAANAINSFGVDLLSKVGKPDSNSLLSPYSIQSALAMTYAGADGVTRDEMARVLHFPKDDAALNRSFMALRRSLDDLVQRSAMGSENLKRMGITNDPVILTVANRLYGQTGYDFRASFLDLVKDEYGAPFEALDFSKDAAGATRQINDWVEQQTRERIRNLIPAGALNDLTRLVLVNAIYLKAPWEEAFSPGRTAPLPFHVDGRRTFNVPTMTGLRGLGYAKGKNFTAVAIPYSGGELQFVVLLPDKVNGLAALETSLTTKLLVECANLSTREALLYIPKFKLEPPSIPLSRQLQALGMKSAFDQPVGSANFGRIAPRLGDYLYISEVFHKTFLNLDEKGTEAAAATAVVDPTTGLPAAKPKPIEVRVDHPFLFAIQHRPSGTCLFLGRVTDPR